MTILFDNRWIGQHGIGRFALEVGRAQCGFVSLNIDGRPSSATDSLRLSAALFNSDRPFFTPGYNFPLLGSVPYTMTVHDVNHFDIGGFSASALSKRTYYSTLLRAGVRNAQRIFTVSDFSKKRISELFGVPLSNIVNVGNGVSETFFCDVSKGSMGVPYILSVTNRKAYKNDVRALVAFSQCSRALKNDIHLFFMGDPNERLVRLATELDVNHRVRFLGSLSEMELVALYKRSQAILFVSLYEGFGLPIVEAFASGVPCITSKVTAMAETSNGAAYLCNPLSVASITHAIDRVLFDQALRRELIAAGLEQVGRHTWSNTRGRVTRELRALGWTG